MSLSQQYLSLHLKAYSKNSGKFILWGIILMLAGILAVSASTLTSIVTVVFLGFLILFSGFVVLIDTFTFWLGKDHGFITHLLAAILYLAAGTLLLANPIEGALTITFILGIIYLLLGLTRIFFSTSIRLPSWRWGLVNGVITTLIGVLILTSGPDFKLFIIGLFIGIDIFFCGLAYTMAGFAIRSKRS